MNPRQIIVVFLLLLSSYTSAGFLSKSVKGAADFIQNFGDDTSRITDEIAETSRKSLKSSDDLIGTQKEFVSSPERTVSDWFSKRTPDDPVGTSRFFDNPPNKLPNASNFSDQADLASFWRWYLGLKSVSVLGKQWEDEFSSEAERVNDTASLSEEVVIVDDEGLPTFNYLVNPVILELETAVESSEDYTAGVSDLFSLMAVSGRAGGLDPGKFLDVERLGSSEPIDLVSFSASAAAFYTMQKNAEMARTFTDYLERDATGFFDNESIDSQLFAPIACVSLLYTVDQLHYDVLPGSGGVFSQYCQKEDLEAKLRLVIEALDSDLEALLSDSPQHSALVQLRVIASLELAVIHGLFGDETNYYKARSDVFDHIKISMPSSDVMTGTFGMLALTEAGFGNFGNAFRFAKETMKYGQSDPEIIGDMTTFMIGLFAYNQDYARMKDLILIQQTMAHPSSKYFIPAQSKLKLAASLLVLENYLYELERS